MNEWVEWKWNEIFLSFSGISMKVLSLSSFFLILHFSTSSLLSYKKESRPFRMNRFSCIHDTNETHINAILDQRERNVQKWERERKKGRKNVQQEEEKESIDNLWMDWKEFVPKREKKLESNVFDGHGQHPFPLYSFNFFVSICSSTTLSMRKEEE